jgi:hypothetical protein
LLVRPEGVEVSQEKGFLVRQQRPGRALEVSVTFSRDAEALQTAVQGHPKMTNQSRMIQALLAVFIPQIVAKRCPLEVESPPIVVSLPLLAVEPALHEVQTILMMHA